MVNTVIRAFYIFQDHLCRRTVCFFSIARHWPFCAILQSTGFIHFFCWLIDLWKLHWKRKRKSLTCNSTQTLHSVWLGCLPPRLPFVSLYSNYQISVYTYNIKQRHIDKTEIFEYSYWERSTWRNFFQEHEERVLKELVVINLEISIHSFQESTVSGIYSFLDCVIIRNYNKYLAIECSQNNKYCDWSAMVINSACVLSKIRKNWQIRQI